MLESDDWMEMMDRRVDPLLRFDVRTVHDQISLEDEDESEETDNQLQGRGPLTRCDLLWMRIERDWESSISSVYDARLAGPSVKASTGCVEEA